MKKMSWKKPRTNCGNCAAKPKNRRALSMEVKINTCSKFMAEKGLTIAFAESATAGWLCSEFALTEESGKVLKGGIACYDASLKVSLLGVPQHLIGCPDHQADR